MILHEMRKSKAYSGAICPKAILCDYRRNFELSDKNAYVDVCQQCGRKQVYRVKNGQIEISRYKRDHIRDVLQSGSGIYEMVYGKRKETAKVKTKEQNAREMQENFAETVRRAMRLENQGRL